MKTIRVQRTTVLILAGAVLLGTGVATAQASNPEQHHKVTLGQRTGSAEGGNTHHGYSIITVDIASVANAKDVRGHDPHGQIGNGPGGDIIPSGLFNVRCTIPPTSTTTTTTTTPPTSTTTTTTTTPPTSTTTTTTPPTSTTTTTPPTSTTTTTPPTTIPPTVGGVGAGEPPANPPVTVAGVGAAKPPKAANPPVTVKGVGAVAPVGAAANPLPVGASAGAADTGGQLVAGGFAAFAGFLMLVAGFVLRRRHGEV